MMVLALPEFSFAYLPQKDVKGCVLVDFITNHTLDLRDKLPDKDDNVVCVSKAPW